MSKHTPGPWRVDAGGFIGGPVGHGHVCQLWNKFEEDFQRNEVTEANARLISAAPELLEALKAVIAVTDRKHNIWDKAHAAIAKAEGKS